MKQTNEVTREMVIAAEAVINPAASNEKPKDCHQIERAIAAALAVAPKPKPDYYDCAGQKFRSLSVAQKCAKFKPNCVLPVHPVYIGPAI